ncbi:hypothetical protein [Streptomyces lunaelactis]|uniref:hypothetical protein n=1 Tax=Streptomyces lunaelactis TaxID=1535768 RepID=UPI001585CC49|nr:hypothetical protein [Streptomyces lunaelactis]NUK84594.1 hypothetical protein [Streptomyces lunaelactis]
MSIRDLWHLRRQKWRVLYGFAAAATVWLAVPGLLVAATGLGLAWPAFTAAWSYDLERRLSGTTSVAYPLVGWCLPIALASLTLLLGFRFSLAPAAVVATGSSPKDALRRSWALTRRSRWLTSGVCLLLTAAAAAVFTALRLALTPLADPARRFMVDLADGNRYAADAIGTLMPSASALLLLPLIVLPPVCAALAVLHAGLSGASGCPGRPGGPDGRRPPCPAPP